jgi:hypothetical protein
MALMFEYIHTQTVIHKTAENLRFYIFSNPVGTGMVNHWLSKKFSSSIYSTTSFGAEVDGVHQLKAGGAPKWP